MGQRSLTKLYDATSTAGGSLDSGAISTEIYNAIVVHIIASGAAAPASAAASAVLDGGALASLGALTLPAAGASVRNIIATSPRSARFQATGGAASTVRLAVYGVRE
ncbi:MAG TPA: hypothetical protein VFN94_10955 [Nitrospiria bacterium]|nr:hypothetical protein [Nitrospiria bacterium]